MSIVTKTGDKGTTALLYNRRVPKSDPRIEACGAIDELNAALGMARATASNDRRSEQLLAIQHDLVALMGEIATTTADHKRYKKDGFALLTPAQTARLETWVADLERNRVPLRGWAMPGHTLPGAALDLARTVCRRAERRVSALGDARQLANPEILVYLNRLSDLLWLLARSADRNTSSAPGAKKPTLAAKARGG